MSEWLDIQADKEHTKRERDKARALRKTQWWLNLLNSGICHYCEEKFDKKELTMDHILPLCRGGKSTKGNIVPCCKECNSEKSYLTPVEIILNDLELGDE